MDNSKQAVFFRHYTEQDYESVCDFLIELNRYDRRHINWNWARFEWMAEHPEFDKSLIASIGLWTEGERVVGAAIYDMYFGEGFCGALPGFETLYPEILDYACRELKDEAGFALAICDQNGSEIEAAESRGFVPTEQAETIMEIVLDKPFPVELPEDLHFAELDPVEDACELQWLFWQGFDHGTDRSEIEKAEEIVPRVRPHLNPHLGVAAADGAGENAAFCCLWVHPDTDYAYVEPVCTIPSYRGRGVGRSVVREALNRARELGAKRAYVISDQTFYEKLGFAKKLRFPFYRKRQN